jgi:large repetitive protein
MNIKASLMGLHRVLPAALVLCCAAPALAQTYLTGVNAPGATHDYPLTIGASTTNLSLTVAGSAATFSHLLLKKGGTPSDTDFDFIAAADGQTNALNLERPELTATNYVLRVRTPTNSAAHSYTVTVVSNQTDLRSLARPTTKPIVGTAQGAVTPGSWQYFRIDITTNLPGWRILLNSVSGTAPDLYVQRGQVPTTTSSLKQSLTQTNDVVAFAGSEVSPGVYYIGVYCPPSVSAPASYTLQTELINFTTLAWDPGVADVGTQIYTHAGSAAGDYYFKLTVENSAVGGWRTALNVSTGEANLYLSLGSPPSAVKYDFKSDRIGSDGFVLSAFTPGQDWYFMVRAQAGARWTLMSGEPFVQDLGMVAGDASSGSGPVTVGAEGIRFFKTALPDNAIAWRLWLNGSNNALLVRKTAVPLPGQADLSQLGQMLVVPNYLVGGQQYLVGVVGNPGAAINLDSRLHAFTDLPFLGSATATVTNFGYTTYRVQVPQDQIAWQVSVVASNGNPNVAVRRNYIPNESYNDGYSEAPGLVTDSVTLVPPPAGSPSGTPGLADGTYYVTVYATNAHTFRLQSGDPEITEIDFVSTTTNSDTNRVGWRYFQVSDILQQQGALGWELFLTNFAPGTQIALRRNAVPGVWNYRNPTQGSLGYTNYLSGSGFLQRPDHQADVWYVGVYNPTAPLGNFTLVTRALTAPAVSFNGGTTSCTDVTAGKWQFFRVDVPSGTLGWDVRLVNVASGSPQLAVRRGSLPVLVNGSLGGINFSGAVTTTNWPAGNQWVAGNDWTDRNLGSDGVIDESGRILTMGTGRPLEPGTYYIGVINDPADLSSMTYSVLSRGIGDGQLIPVNDLAFYGGAVTSNGLAPRELAVYRVQVPVNVSTWKVKLSMTSGDAVLAAAKDRLPNITAAVNGSVTNLFAAGKKMPRPGNEHFLLLPLDWGTNVMSGTYYFVVAAEGLTSSNKTAIGTGTSAYTLQSLGPQTEIDLGTLGDADIIYQGQLEGGDSASYYFSNTVDTLGFEISLENRVGNPVVVSSGEQDLVDPGSGSGQAVDPYGNEGGRIGWVASKGIITVADPYPIENITIKARDDGTRTWPDASYTLRVRRLVPKPLAFDGGNMTVNDQSDTWRFYRVDVPADAVGWDLRLSDVTAGRPKMVICRDYLGIIANTAGLNPGSDIEWWPGDRWAIGADWTLRSYSSDGVVNNDGRVAAMGMGRPLEPGTYYVSVNNPDAPNVIAGYTITSRGIGEGFVIPVVDLPFGGGTVTNQALAPREAAYYRVVMPDTAMTWHARLQTTSGEAMLVTLTNTVPSVVSGRGSSTGKAMQKAREEQYLVLPSQGQDFLGSITNYLAVVSEGSTNAAFPTRIGTGTSSYVLESLGELAVIDLGQIGSVDLLHTNTVQGGEVCAYQFRVPDGVFSLEARLENRTNNPVMVVRAGPAFPNPGAGSTTQGPGAVSTDDYGTEGGWGIALPSIGNANASLITLANPTNGIYTLMVKARGVSGNYTNAGYTLRVRALPLSDLNFDAGLYTVTNQPAGTWRYFKVEVPADALGWDLRLVNVAAGLPRLVVRRDDLPTSLTTAGGWMGAPGITTNWPSLATWGAAGDWTRRGYSTDNTVNEDGRILAMGMGRPLEPGTYYVGVINSAGTNAMNYSIRSRGIGPGLAIPVMDLPLTGGSDTVPALAAREAAYYRVVVPQGSPSWKLRLEPTAGEAMLLVVSNCVPNVDSGRASSPLAGKLMQKAANEHYLLLPAGGQAQLAGGTFYVAVVSEGINPPSAARIGSGNSGFTLTSQGAVPVADLGVVGTQDLLAPTEEVEGGETRFYRFAVPAGTPAFDVRLENRVGNPAVVMTEVDRLPDPGISLGGVRDDYGSEGGYPASIVNANLITVPAPAGTNYLLAVKARANTSQQYPNATYTLRVHSIPSPDLNFTPEFNTNGLSNVAAGLLVDNQRTYYRVIVPTNVLGAPLLGWELDLAQSSGMAFVRVRKDQLPSDAYGPGVPFQPASSVITPPFLTSGTWYVEVRGSNTTGFTLTSRAVALQRPAWSMPALGGPVTTPGVVAPTFGDTGVDGNGTDLPDDQGVDLQQGYYHFYAVEVPADNGGLFRVALEAISGNPDFYLRTNAVPTLSHAVDGRAGTTVDRFLTGTTTEYGNWVPLNSSRIETQLKAGTWYLGVRAALGANARYRLRLSTGTITDLPLDSPLLSSQTVLGGDWRYYRVAIPREAPVNWRVTFSEQAGDVVMYLRDTVPPGNGASTNLTDIKDWVSDSKNNATNGTYQSYDAPGTYSFNVPPVRPGSVYYLGLRNKGGVNANFSLQSTTSGGTNPVLPTIEFYGGSVTNTLPPNGQLAFRIFAPADAARWKHGSIHSNVVQLCLENGTMPRNNASYDDWRSSGANSTNNVYLGGWPWVPNVSYYLLVTNNSAVPQPFTFTMDGKSVTTDDNDSDGMRDAWEYQYFGSLSQTPAGDFDGDGVSNLNEYLEGTNPTNNASLRPRLTVLATNGVVVANPQASNYTYGANVVLTATPNVGYDFIGWSGSAIGTANPLSLVMTNSKTLTANFRVPGDDFVQRVPIAGAGATVTGSNVGATKEAGEPNHAGNFGGHSVWWTWTAPFTGSVTFSTAGTTFANALAVYTGSSITTLADAGHDQNSGGPNTSVVSFNASAGTTYQIAVDGIGTSTGSITLSVSMENLLALDNAEWLPGSGFRFELLSQSGQTVRIDVSTDLRNWIAATNVVNTNGSMFVTDGGPTNAFRFYRAVIP